MDPTTVRVSRAFGGKDRHSKVCTTRGLRDTRVRLSLPTAIQLYDLQDRLGLSQPSKVVDWLLNVAKHEIDELRPVAVPPGSFSLNHHHHHHHEMLSSHEVRASQSIKEGLISTSSSSRNNWEEPKGLPRSNLWSTVNLLRENSKEVATRGTMMNEKAKQLVGDGGGHASEDSSINNLLPRSQNSSFPGPGGNPNMSGSIPSRLKMFDLSDLDDLNLLETSPQKKHKTEVPSHSASKSMSKSGDYQTPAKRSLSKDATTNYLKNGKLEKEFALRDEVPTHLVPMVSCFSHDIPRGIYDDKLKMEIGALIDHAASSLVHGLTDFLLVTQKFNNMQASLQEEKQKALQHVTQLTNEVQKHEKDKQLLEREVADLKDQVSILLSSNQEYIAANEELVSIKGFVVKKGYELAKCDVVIHGDPSWDLNMIPKWDRKEIEASLLESASTTKNKDGCFVKPEPVTTP